MKKAISIFLSLAMMLSVCVYQVGIGASVISEPVQVREVNELRERNSETFLLSDGSYRCIVYSDDKYYPSENGELKEIDNSIVKTEFMHNGRVYTYKNAANETHFYFANEEPSVLIESPNGRIAFSLIGADGTMAHPNADNAYQKLFDYQISGKNSISYPEVQHATELIYTACNGELKEFILLRDADAPGELRFRFETEGLYAKPTETGNVEFIDRDGKSVFKLGKLFAVDARGEYTDELIYKILSSDEKGSEIAISVSEKYLKAADRVFPVLIDPSVMLTGTTTTYDSFVSSTKPTTNYYMSTNLRTGKDEPYGVRRTYIKFTIPSTVSGYVTDSYIRIKKHSGAAPSVRAYRVTQNWSPSVVTWNNKPSHISALSSSLSTHISNNWYKLNVTYIVKDWVSGANSNYGFMLKDITETDTSQWTTFYSSEALSPNKPELHITYKYAGSRPYQPTSSTDVNCMGYALEYGQYIKGSDLGILKSELNGKTTEQLLDYIKIKANTWMTSNLGNTNFGTISGYDSDIPDGWFRVVLRVGFIDRNGNNKLDAYEETFDYHWWYQTKNGDWADKIGGHPSQNRTGTAGVNPVGHNWPNPYVTGLFYNSSGVFYKVRDIRNISW